MTVHRFSVKCLMVLQFSYMDSLFKETALKKKDKTKNPKHLYTHKKKTQLANEKIELVLNSKFAYRITKKILL